jgi:tRNA(Ile)-lysidine synthase
VGPALEVADCRTAVRRALRDLVGHPRPRVLVAVSGGPDSLALLGATCFAAPRMGVAVGAVTVDHGLQPGSTQRARAVAAAAARLGAEPVSVAHVTVDGGGGPEGAARRARYDALARAARAVRAQAVLLAHTRDDQAETVLLGLARGSGSRSLAGMASVAGIYRRPFLALGRATVAAAADAMAAAGGMAPWDDPHNLDRAFARVRVRHDVLPVLEADLGPGIGAALARSADLLRDDADALDEWARTQVPALVTVPATVAADRESTTGVDAVGLSALPRAIRTRVLRWAALSAGAPASDLTAGHVSALDTLVMGDSAGMSIDLPGRVRAHRAGGRLYLSRGT